VTLEITAAKVRADSIGVETEPPMNDLIEIGVFARDENDRGPGESLYLQRYRIRSGRQTITFPLRASRRGRGSIRT